MKTLTESAKEVVSAAIELISDPAKWTTGANARDENDLVVSPTREKACKWCALGALQNQSVLLTGDLYVSNYISTVFHDKFARTISITNDNKGREVIINKLQDLIS